jgi:hypothetical protein
MSDDVQGVVRSDVCAHREMVCTHLLCLTIDAASPYPPTRHVVVVLMGRFGMFGLRHCTVCLGVCQGAAVSNCLPQALQVAGV